tara:strand:- start:459 stop:830 length:372 start_codon:yes stop_codon:yes gene_type:complete
MSKKYFNISEVSKILELKEHVIRYWDSIDPKTNKLRFEGISTKSKGGTRYFNKENIAKLTKLKHLIYENGNHNYSLALANKFLSLNKNYTNKDNFKEIHKELNHDQNTKNIRVILDKIRILCK